MSTPSLIYIPNRRPTIGERRKEKTRVFCRLSPSFFFFGVVVRRSPHLPVCTRPGCFSPVAIISQEREPSKEREPRGDDRTAHGPSFYTRRANIKPKRVAPIFPSLVALAPSNSSGCVVRSFIQKKEEETLSFFLAVCARLLCLGTECADHRQSASNRLVFSSFFFCLFSRKLIDSSGELS